MINGPEPTEGEKQDYLRADPFPHAVWYNFLDRDKVTQAAEEVAWLEATSPEKNVFHTQKKRTFTPRSYSWYPESIQNVVSYLTSPAALVWLEALTGVRGLIPDPYFFGGGIHQVALGGFLKVHADYNYHEKLDLYRRVNLLLYLNPHWDGAWGGELELWDRKMSKCVKKVPPLLNTVVIFNTGPTSYHGHPTPLECPEGVTRNSLALYYYTVERPRGFGKGTYTRYKERPGEHFNPPLMTRLRERWRLAKKYKNRERI